MVGDLERDSRYVIAQSSLQNNIHSMRSFLWKMRKCQGKNIQY